MEPTDAFLAEELIPVDVAGLELRDGGETTVGAGAGAAAAVAALDEVESVADRAADAIIGHPLHVRDVNATLQHEVLNETADRIVRERRDRRRLETKATTETAHDVVLAAAFPHLEVTRRMDASVARIETKHDFAERGGVPLARASRLDDQFFVFHTLEYPK